MFVVYPRSKLRGITIFPFKKRLYGCLYRGDLAQLGGMAQLGEILPSLRNSYKGMICSYEK